MYDIKKGEMILVTEDESREHEGAFICAAEFATTENLNFTMTAAKTVAIGVAETLLK